MRLVPLDVLPPSAARRALETLAAAGCEVMVMPSTSAIGDWTIWLGELARARRDEDGAVPAMVWLLSWRHLCASAGLTGYVAGIMALDELGEH